MDAVGSSVMSIHLEHLSKHYGAVIAVDDVDLVLPAGKVTAIVGPSGSGKTSLLNLVAGLLRPTAGRIHLHGVDVTNVPPEKRDIGYVFQSYALFPHLNVRENVGFGVEGKVRRAAIVDDLLRRFRIEALAERRPQELSGGERQRVALARALAREPKLLLFDEPLSALDAQLREQLRHELASLFHELGRTALYVTHDRQEAMLLADHVVVMRSGRVLQAGSPADLYRHPANAFVASFFGDANLISGTADASGWVETALGRFAVSNRDDAPAGEVLLVVRPEMVRLSDSPSALQVLVDRASFLGPRYRVEGRVGERTLIFDLPASGSIMRGQTLALEITQEWLHAVPVEHPTATSGATHESRRNRR
jgi:ABC-type Fe3+/spermidine/putrescine transport system ATPase subunit